jgi:hypothetical protein
LLVSVAGTFGINWAQATSTASATTLRAGSYLTVNQLNTGTASGTALHTYTTPGSFVETIPAGFTTVLIEAWGASAGGGGGAGTPPSPPLGAGGGGGGSGAYVRSSYPVAGLGGQTLAFTVGGLGSGGILGTDGTVGGDTTIVSGTMTITSIDAGGGQPGLHAPNSVTAGSAGAGGTAIGGTLINSNGNSGSPGVRNSTGQGGRGGPGIPGINNGGAPGGSGGDPSGLNIGFNGGNGVIAFSYS